MHRSILALAAAFSAAAFSIRAAAVAMIDFAIAYAFAWLGDARAFIETAPRTAVAGGPALHYDAPPIHGLRHEAGVSRRAAERHT